MSQDHKPPRSAAAPVAAPQGGAVSLGAARRETNNVRSAQRGTTEAPWIRWTLTGIALAFMFLFLVLPLAAVFTEALRKGWDAYWEALKEPDAWAAIRLTLLTAAVAVPLNLAFGIAGVALSQIDNVSPNLGQSYIVDSFMVVVFGGVGNLWGTLVGAFSLGILNKFLEPYAGAVLGKILVLVLIILFIQKKPRGLFALKGRAVEA